MEWPVFRKSCYISTCGDFTFSSKSGFRNLRGKTLTCSERRRSMLRASMARPRYSLTSSSGSFTSMLSPKPNLHDMKLKSSCFFKLNSSVKIWAYTQLGSFWINLDLIGINFHFMTTMLTSRITERYFSNLVTLHYFICLVQLNVNHFSHFYVNKYFILYSSQLLFSLIVLWPWTSPNTLLHVLSLNTQYSLSSTITHQPPPPSPSPSQSWISRVHKQDNDLLIVNVSVPVVIVSHQFHVFGCPMYSQRVPTPHVGQGFGLFLLEIKSRKSLWSQLKKELKFKSVCNFLLH